LAVPAGALGIVQGPEQALAALQVQLVATLVDGQLRPTQVQGLAADPATVNDERQDRVGVLGRVDAPARVIRPDVAGVPDPSGLHPARGKEDVAPARLAAVLVVDLPALAV